MAQVFQQQQPDIQGQAIGELNRPHVSYKNISPIILPEITKPDFELNAHLINLAEAKPFGGTPSENPLQHITRLKRLGGTTKINGVGEDYITRKLFEFSLTGKAEQWFVALPPSSLNGWLHMQKDFLNHFFQKSKTAEIQRMLAKFCQAPEESFSDAWNHLKSLGRECPHHGLTPLQLLNFFYDGIRKECKAALDAASNGNFMTRTGIEGTQPIENLVESSVDIVPEEGNYKSICFIDSQGITDRIESIEQLLIGGNWEVQAVEQGGQRDLKRQEDESYVNGHQAKQGSNLV